MSGRSLVKSLRTCLDAKENNRVDGGSGIEDSLDFVGQHREEGFVIIGDQEVPERRQVNSRIDRTKGFRRAQRATGRGCE